MVCWKIHWWFSHWNLHLHRIFLPRLIKKDGRCLTRGNPRDLNWLLVGRELRSHGYPYSPLKGELRSYQEGSNQMLAESCVFYLGFLWDFGCQLWSSVLTAVLSHGVELKIAQTYQKVTARPYGLPARLEWSSNIILRPAQNLRRASVLVFTRRRTLNPKILKPWNLWIRKQKTLRIRSIFKSIFCNFSSHVRRRGILNVAVRATGFVRKVRRSIAFKGKSKDQLIN